MPAATESVGAGPRCPAVSPTLAGLHLSSDCFGLLLLFFLPHLGRSLPTCPSLSCDQHTFQRPSLCLPTRRCPGTPVQTPAPETSHLLRRPGARGPGRFDCSSQDPRHGHALFLQQGALQAQAACIGVFDKHFLGTNVVPSPGLRDGDMEVKNKTVLLPRSLWF